MNNIDPDIQSDDIKITGSSHWEEFRRKGNRVWFRRKGANTGTIFISPVERFFIPDKITDGPGFKVVRQTANVAVVEVDDKYL